MRWGLTKLDYARFFIPWDTFGTANSSNQCIDNSASTYSSLQGAAAQRLYDSIEAASQLGLDVLIAPEEGTPGQPEAAGDPSNPTPYEYSCAIGGMLNVIHNVWKISSTVLSYELYNEPDIVGLTPLNVTNYFPAWAYWQQTYGWSDNLIVGAFGDRAMTEAAKGSSSYIAQYLSDIEADYDNDSQSGYYDYPIAVSGHAYDDVDDSYQSGDDHAETSALVSDSDSYLVGDPPVWITEAAVVQSQTGAPTAGGLATGCPSGGTHSDRDPNDNGSISACVDDSPIHQANAAEGFDNLINVPGVSAVFYYDFVQNFNYDAALVANDQPNNGGDCSAGAIYPSGGCQGSPRPSLCMIDEYFTNGYSPSQCVNNATFTDTHSITGSTYQYGEEPTQGTSNPICSPGPVEAGEQSCCAIGQGGTGFASVTVTDDDWMDLEQSLADPCWRQTGGQG